MFEGQKKWILTYLSVVTYYFSKQSAAEVAQKERFCMFALLLLGRSQIFCLLTLLNTYNSYHIPWNAAAGTALPYYCARQGKREITHANCCNFSETLDQNEKKMRLFSWTDKDRAYLRLANVNQGIRLIATDSLIIPNNTKYMPGMGKFTPTSISIPSS